MSWFSGAVERDRINRMLEEVRRDTTQTASGLQTHLAECKVNGEQTQKHLERQDELLKNIQRVLFKVFWTVLVGLVTVIGAVLLPTIHVHLGG